MIRVHRHNDYLTMWAEIEAEEMLSADFVDVILGPFVKTHDQNDDPLGLYLISGQLVWILDGISAGGREWERGVEIEHDD